MPSASVPCRLSVLALLVAAPALAQEKQVGDVPYVPTPEPVVDAMLKLAEVGPDDRLLDLGSGDGRIVVTAARQHGARGTGVDLNPVRIAEARENARDAGVTDQVEFIQGDLFDVDLSQADVLTMYLLPQINLDLRPKILEQMRPGARVVSHDFNMGEWAPDRQIEVPDEGSPVYLWIVPARVEGAWRLDTGDGELWRLDIDQEFQTISGTATRGNERIELGQGVLKGDQVTFQWPDGRRFVGRVGEDERRMVGLTDGGEGQVAQSGDWEAVRDGS